MTWTVMDAPPVEHRFALTLAVKAPLIAMPSPLADADAVIFCGELEGAGAVAPLAADALVAVAVDDPPLEEHPAQAAAHKAMMIGMAVVA